MKANIHPTTKFVKLHCSGCGTDFNIVACNIEEDTVLAETCANCHSAWTGKRVISSQGAVANFKEKYSQFSDDLF